MYDEQEEPFIATANGVTLADIYYRLIGNLTTAENSSQVFLQRYFYNVIFIKACRRLRTLQPNQQLIYLMLLERCHRQQLHNHANAFAWITIVLRK